MRVQIYILMGGLLLLGACGMRTSSNVRPVAGSGSTTVLSGYSGKTASQIIVTEQDITNRKYEALGDISVTVAKNTLFDPDPTRELVNEALQRRAAALGADAVILVHYGTVGFGFFTWGKLEGSGRAIVFK